MKKESFIISALKSLLYAVFWLFKKTFSNVVSFFLTIIGIFVVLWVITFFIKDSFFKSVFISSSNYSTFSTKLEDISTTEVIESSSLNTSKHLLVFSSAHCTYCVIQKKYIKKIKDSGIKVYYVIPEEERKESVATGEYNELANRVFVSYGDQIFTTLGVFVLPTTIIVDEVGNIIKRYQGDINEKDAKNIIKTLQK